MTSKPEPRWTVYSGRLLNVCLELAMLNSYATRGSAPPERLRDLARSRYVRNVLTRGQA